MKIMNARRDTLLVVMSCVLLAGACTAPSSARVAETPAPAATQWTAALIDTLIELGRDDQRGRDGIAQAVAAQDTASLFRMLRADSARSRWLRQTVATLGWPARTVVGDSAAGAAWLILQHSPMSEWQEEMLPTLELLTRRGEIAPSDLALFTDRVLVRRGQPQRYGSQFDVVDGRLVPAPVADLSQLDARRAGVGLPAMAEYVRLLGELYGLPVVWPPL
jgi:hypothetical protein